MALPRERAIHHRRLKVAVGSLVPRTRRGPHLGSPQFGLADRNTLRRRHLSRRALVRSIVIARQAGGRIVVRQLSVPVAVFTAAPDGSVPSIVIIETVHSAVATEPEEERRL